MRTFLFIAIVSGLGIRFTLSWFAENEIRGAAAAEPSWSNAQVVRAESVAQGMRRVTKKHDCELDESSLTVKVAATTGDPLKVASNGSVWQANAATQRIDIAFTCKRRGPLFFKKDLRVEVHTQAVGVGPADEYPK
ncbi:MAG: hypothetical protein JNM17_04555 [Archangium sp.]|nr:hypothetical protein [Archangium sp.]